MLTTFKHTPLLSLSLFDNVKWALSFCQMGLMENWINIQSKVYIYASYKMSKFISWPPDKRRASFFHIVNWFKNLIRLFTVACKRIRDASRYAYYHSCGTFTCHLLGYAYMSLFERQGVRLPILLEISLKIWCILNK